MRFLIVDDSATMRRIVVNLLERLGVSDPIEAEDGQDALERFDDSVGFVITDWEMPRMNGIELVRRIRRIPGGASVPVLMISGRTAAEDVAVALSAGITDYIHKPFTPETLKSRLEQYLPASSSR